MRLNLLKNKSGIISGICIGILLFQSIFLQSWIMIDKRVPLENGENENMHGSDSWVLIKKTIHIDNNWSATESLYDWCSGGGTPGNPYVIENVTIDVQNVGSCIYIQNSIDYFIIQNCTLLNSEASPNSAIQLEFVSNGKILDNNISNNNGRAISLFSASNNRIEENNIVNNGYGITLTYGGANVVTKNYIEESDFYGIYLWNSDDNIITENEINHNGWYAGGYHGIYISESGSPSYVDSINNTIKHNNVHHNRKSGIYINSCDDNKIFGNIIENNIEHGIFLDDSDDVTVVGNIIHGDLTIQSSLNTKVEWNAVNSVLDPFTIDELGGGDFTWAQVSEFAWCLGNGSFINPYTISNVVVMATTGSCIQIKNSFNKHFIIDNCLLMDAPSTGGSAGIKLDWVHNGTLFQNSIEENYAGIYLSHCENITINDNTLDENTGMGIVLYQSKQNQIIDNEQFGSLYYGLFINAVSNNNTVSRNTFQNNTGAALHGDGIQILNSEDNIITDNVLLNNDRGIRIQDNSHNNTIIQNTIHNNTKYGALVIADTRESYDNLFYLNSFNNPQGQNAYDNGTNTRWDNGMLGNYWSNYTGKDANDDGIGDSIHTLPGLGGGIDNFPIWNDGIDTPEGLDPITLAIIIGISVVGSVALIGIVFYYLRKRRNSN